MPSIRVFEPALCCNTGVCGPDPSEALLAFTADLDHVVTRGADAARHNLANDPAAFSQVEPVREFLRQSGSDGLPVVVVDGAIVLTGRYPTRAELVRYAGLEPGGVLPLTAVTSAGGGTCCGGSSSSCC